MTLPPLAHAAAPVSLALSDDLGDDLRYVGQYAGMALTVCMCLGLYQDYSDVLSYSLDCQGIECFLPLSDHVLSLEDEHDVLAIKNGAASGARRASEVRALRHPVRS